MAEQVQTRLVRFLAETYQVDADDIRLDESLVDQGIIDSIGLIEIAGFIEEQYGVVVEEAQMTRENFGSVLKMAAFIEQRRAAMERV